jgi:hypothetical protein
MIKIYLHRLNDIEEVFISMIFCSQIIYLKIDQINNREIELFLRQFLTKINIFVYYVSVFQLQMIKVLGNSTS